MSLAEQRLREMGLELPAPLQPVGVYVPTVRTGQLVFVSGQIPLKDGAVVYQGKLGSDLTVAEGQAAAQLAALNALAALKAELGDLDRIARIVKLVGWVNSAPGFVEQPQVINGASELMVAVFGDAGRHARSAVGANELPRNVAVEIELTVEVRP